MDMAKEAISLLYVIDANADKIVIITCGLSFAVTIWKVLKLIPIVKREDQKFPYYTLQRVETYTKNTATYDEEATRKLSYLMGPLLLCHCVQIFL